MNCAWSTAEDCLGSDHLPVIIQLNENTKDDELDTEDKIPKFQYKHADWEAFQAFLISSNIHTIENDDVNIFYSNFIKTILLAAEHSIPKIKSKKISKHTRNAWWSKYCKQAVCLKKEQFKKWLKNRTEEHFVSMKREKIQCKNRKLKRNSGLTFVRTKCQNQKTKSSLFAMFIIIIICIFIIIVVAIIFNITTTISIVAINSPSSWSSSPSSSASP